ncbi:hypothetical protein B0H12DRAFT_449615 [Mycena haematopus]|nr:hypothetical protein B0H12DRAFT_449615 [Mycena haematopus]
MCSSMYAKKKSPAVWNEEGRMVASVPECGRCRGAEEPVSSNLAGSECGGRSSTRRTAPYCDPISFRLFPPPTTRTQNQTPTRRCSHCSPANSPLISSASSPLSSAHASPRLALAGTGVAGKTGGAAATGAACRTETGPSPPRACRARRHRRVHPQSAGATARAGW